MRRGGQELLDLLPVEREIGEPVVGEAAGEPVDAADCLVLAQGSRIVIEPLDDLH